MTAADPYAPPLAWWGHAWRMLLALAVSTIALIGPADGSWDDVPWLFFLDLGVGIVSFVLAFGFRRRWPFAIALTLNLFGLVSISSAGPALLASVSMATRRRTWQIVAVAAASIGAALVYNATQVEQPQQPWWLELIFAVAITVAMLAVGMYIGSRRELLWTLRERARAAEEQQELRLTSARASERERIAREMHDVLAHRISMVSMHAGALAYRTDLPPEQVRETAELIQSTSHQALTELRQVLGVLRGDGVMSDRPQPTLGDLPELADDARSAGMRVDLDVVVDSGAGVPDAVGRTVYRIVQEGLTNARKHALGAAVKVRVEGTAGDGVDVWVRNGVRQRDRTTTPGAGLGLVGLRERTELAGGRLDVASEGSTFSLHGWLPWPT